MSTALRRAEVAYILLRLAHLSEWEPVGGLLETARMALRGEGGLSMTEVDTLHEIDRRWEELGLHLREFYSAHLDESAASYTLWQILNGHSQNMKWMYRTLSELYEGWCGYAPAVELIPRIL